MTDTKKKKQGHAGGKNQKKATEAANKRRKIKGPALKQKKTGKPVNDGIEKETYLAMKEAYMQTQTIAHVQRTCDVTFNCARKYIRVGVLDKGMPPIHDAYIAWMNKEMKKQDITHSKAMAAYIKLIRKVKDIYAAKIEQMVPEDLTADNLPEKLDKLMKSESFAMGGPDSRVEVDVRSQLMEIAAEEGLDYDDMVILYQKAGGSIAALTNTKEN